MKFWNRLRIMKIFFQLVRNPNRTDLIFEGVRIFSNDRNQEPVKAIEEIVLADEGFRSMYIESYVPNPPALNDLAALPENSFGRALYQHMKSNNLRFDLFPRLESRRPIEYLSTRIYQDHDLWHALLGYGVEVEDELAIQAFGVAQYQSPIGTMIIAGGLLHLLGLSPKRAVLAFKKINEGYNLGRRSPFLLPVRLHDLLPRPLSEVRELCGVA
jgi:ubiquinone biosynthesis protein Coq4